MVDFQQCLRPSFFALTSLTVAITIALGSAEAADDWTLLRGTSYTNEMGTYPVTQGNPAYPRSRSNAITWVGSDRGTVWMFGGRYFGTSTGHMNDLWSYKPDTNEWTWVTGSDSIMGPVDFLTYHRIPECPGAGQGL